MSVKNNGILAAVAALVSLNVDGAPICDQLVNDKVVSGFTVAEYDGTGRVIVIAEVEKDGGGTEYRALADNNGEVRIYASAAAAFSVCKRNAGADVAVYPFVKQGSVGDPVKTLIAKHKAYKAEDAKATASTTAIAAKITAADALGWDTAVGTPEAVEYADMEARQTAIAEWKTFTGAKVTTLTAALVTAGIDPGTYLPV